MFPSILAALLALTAAAAAQTPDPALLRAQQSFRSHQPGQSYSDRADVRAIQEGCALPCASPAEVTAYLDGVAAAARSLGLSAELPALRQRYAPSGIPRKKAQSSTAGGTTPAGRRDGQDASLQKGRTAALKSGAGIAAALDQRRQAETLPMGGAGGGVLPGRQLTEAERKAALESYLLSPSGDSRHLRTLAVKAPPPVRRRTQVEPPRLSRFDRALLWVDEKVGSKNLDRISNVTAGFGDSLSFGFSKWARKKISGGKDPANTDSLDYTAGALGGVAYSMLLGGAGVLKPLTAGVQTVTRWAPAAENGARVLKQGQFVMAGTGRGISGAINWSKAGGPELWWKFGRQYLSSGSTKVSGRMLRYPIQEEGMIRGTIKGVMGQRVYTGPTVLLP
jgi:hypothetical protein